MTDAYVEDDGSRPLSLTVNLGPGAQIGLVSEVLADISAVLAAGAALDSYTHWSDFQPRALSRVEPLSEFYFWSLWSPRLYAHLDKQPLTFDVPENVFTLERVTFENPVAVTGVLTALAGLGIPSILRIVRDWKTDRRIQAARATEAEESQRAFSRLRNAVVDRVVKEIGSGDVDRVDEIVATCVGAMDRLMILGLDVDGLDDRKE
jgi:hypothetical protein